MQRLIVGALALVACTGAGQRTSWASDDPSRPFVMGSAPANAPQIEAIARRCGLGRIERVERSGLTWIIARDVLAKEASSNAAVICVSEWAMAHPQMRLLFFGEQSH